MRIRFTIERPNVPLHLVRVRCPNCGAVLGEVAGDALIRCRSCRVWALISPDGEAFYSDKR